VGTSKLGRIPFRTAEIIPDEPDGRRVTYVTGINCSGTHQNEVIQRVRHPDGQGFEYVIMRGLSSAKAAAICLILNAPEV
jgi:hypothetical protein